MLPTKVNPGKAVLSKAMAPLDEAKYLRTMHSMRFVPAVSHGTMSIESKYHSCELPRDGPIETLAPFIMSL